LALLCSAISFKFGEWYTRYDNSLLAQLRNGCLVSEQLVQLCNCSYRDYWFIEHRR